MSTGPGLKISWSHRLFLKINKLRTKFFVWIGLRTPIYLQWWMLVWRLSWAAEKPSPSVVTIAPSATSSKYFFLSFELLLLLLLLLLFFVEIINNSVEAKSISQERKGCARAPPSGDLFRFVFGCSSARSQLSLRVCIFPSSPARPRPPAAHATAPQLPPPATNWVPPASPSPPGRTRLQLQEDSIHSTSQR